MLYRLCNLFKRIQDQRLSDAKVSREKKKKVLEEIWDKFTTNEEFYKIHGPDFKVVCYCMSTVIVIMDSGSI